MSAPTDADYRDLLAFRTALLRFQRRSEERARSVGLTPTQHQLLLAIRGHGGGDPTVSEVAAHLMLRQHSVVELVNRAERAGLVRRVRDNRDGRVVRLRLTERGSECLAALSASHLAELSQLAAMISGLPATDGAAPAGSAGYPAADGDRDTPGAPPGNVPRAADPGRMDGQGPG